MTPTKDTLNQLYWIERRSIKSICEITGLKSKAIKDLLYQYKIRIKTHSESIKDQWVSAKDRREKQSQWAKKAFAPMWGTHSKKPEVAAKISASKMGSKNPMWGKFGKMNPAYLGGKKSWEKGRKIRLKKKKDIIAKLGGKCFKCNTSQNLTIHHDPPRRICRSHDLKYLRILCKDCHFHGPNHSR